MIYNDTSTKQGLLQDCEFWCNLQDGDITGATSTYTKQVFTSLINRRYERALGMLGAGSRTAQADDTNYLNQPFSTFNIVSGQNDYQFLTDADGNPITDITGVAILTENGGTEFTVLNRLAIGDTRTTNECSGSLQTISQEDYELILSPNPSNSGVPTGYLEQNNTIFLDKKPNYSATNGGKLFYKRVPSYFAITDTTKAPGFSADHHRILSLGASYDWILVNKPDQATLITRIERELMRAEDEFKTFARMRNPMKGRMTTSNESTR